MGNASHIPILSTDKRGSCAVAKYILRVTNFLLKLLDALVVLQFRETIVSFSHYIKIYSRHQSAQEQVLLQNIYYICLKDSGAAFLSHFFFFTKQKSWSLQSSGRLASWKWPTSVLPAKQNPTVQERMGKSQNNPRVLLVEQYKTLDVKMPGSEIYLRVLPAQQYQAWHVKSEANTGRSKRKQKRQPSDEFWRLELQAI